MIPRQEWKRRMLKPGVWGDEVVLTFASNIVIIPALRESSVHQGLGVQLIKSERSQNNDPPPLFQFSFSETDFSDVRSGQNVLRTFLATNQNDWDQLPTELILICQRRVFRTFKSWYLQILRGRNFHSKSN